MLRTGVFVAIANFTAGYRLGPGAGQCIGSFLTTFSGARAAIEAGTSTIMPYYSAPKGKEFEEVGFSFNKAIIQDPLRKQLGFTGIVNSDTGPIDLMPWGVESLTLPQRYQKALDAGVDLFSGTADPTILLQTVRQGLVSDARLDESVRRLLHEKFALGLFENPYVDVEQAERLVGSAPFQKRADLAQRKSIVLLRNDAPRGNARLLPLKPNTKVYFETYYDNGRGTNPINVTKPTRPPAGLEFVPTPDEALLDVVSGAFKPTGKLPFTIPTSEKAVADNQSDVPGYREGAGYALFPFGHGLGY
jgi:beta-glucosidase